MILWFERHRKLTWVITFIIAVFIFYFSSLTFETFGVGGGSRNIISIIYHIAIFFFLSLFFFMSLINGRKNYLIFLTGILILIAYGILDEMHQFFVPGRFCSLSDLGLDSVGVLFAFMIYVISLENRKL